MGFNPPFSREAGKSNIEKWGRLIVDRFKNAIMKTDKGVRKPNFVEKGLESIWAHSHPSTPIGQIPE
jgi:hypothetical protein